MSQNEGNITNYTGEPITVTWGAETYSPVPFNSFTVGPFSITTKVQANETPKQAYERAWRYLTKLAETNYIAKRTAYYDKVEGQRK